MVRKHSLLIAAVVAAAFGADQNDGGECTGEMCADSGPAMLQQNKVRSRQVRVPAMEATDQSGVQTGAPAVYVERSLVAVEGKTIQSYERTDLATCKAHCDATETCKSFSLLHDGEECQLKDKQVSRADYASACCEDDCCASTRCEDDLQLCAANWTTYYQQAAGAFPAWDMTHVDQACANIISAHGSLVETGEEISGPAIPHWSVRHLKIDVDNDLLYYGSSDIQEEVPNAAERAVLFFHGAARDAISYFCSIKRIMMEQGSDDPLKTLMLAPKFAYDEDFENYAIDTRTVLWWNGSKPWGDYRLGAHSSRGDYSSFDIIDRMILMLEDEANFPNLKDILLIGHSAGGQVVQRYALTTKLSPGTAATPRESGVSIRYAIANPSTYAYLDKNRWTYDCDTTKCFSLDTGYRPYDRSDGQNGWKANGRRRRAETPETTLEQSGARRRAMGFWGVGGATDQLRRRRNGNRRFLCRTGKGVPDSSDSAHYWGYGLVDSITTNRVPYVASIDVAQAKAWYKDREVVYFVGEEDTCTDDLLKFCDPSCWQWDIRNPTYNQTCGRTKMDMSCEAMLQGPNRRERGKNYMTHLEEYYGEKVHALHIIDRVGHQAEPMFLSPKVMDVLFPVPAAHDNTTCRAWDHSNDTDCCSAAGSYCTDSHVKVQLGRCAESYKWCRESGCWSYNCIAPL